MRLFGAILTLSVVIQCSSKSVVEALMRIVSLNSEVSSGRGCFISWGLGLLLAEYPPLTCCLLAGMNAAVRAVVRVGIFTGARVFFVHEVGFVRLAFCQSLFPVYSIPCPFPNPRP